MSLKIISRLIKSKSPGAPFTSELSRHLVGKNFVPRTTEEVGLCRRIGHWHLSSELHSISPEADTLITTEFSLVHSLVHTTHACSKQTAGWDHRVRGKSRWKWSLFILEEIVLSRDESGDNKGRWVIVSW